MQRKNHKSPNGYVLCVGITSEVGHLCEIIIPPHRLNRDDYLCSKNFELGPLLEMCYKKSEKYGIIISLGHVTEFYTIIQTGKHTMCKTEHIYKARIPRSHSKGGQSQGRIGRIHDSLIDDMISKINTLSIKYFGDQRIGNLNVKSVLLSGTSTNKNIITDSLKKIIPIGAITTTGIGGETEALSLFMENYDSLFLTPQLRKYKKNLIQTIDNNYDMILIGYEEIICFRDYKAIETIYVTTIELEEEMMSFNQGDIFYTIVRLKTLPISGITCIGIKRIEFKDFSSESLHMVMDTESE